MGQTTGTGSRPASSGSRQLSSSSMLRPGSGASHTSGRGVINTGFEEEKMSLPGSIDVQDDNTGKENPNFTVLDEDKGKLIMISKAMVYVSIIQLFYFLTHLCLVHLCCLHPLSFQLSNSKIANTDIVNYFFHYKSRSILETDTIVESSCSTEIMM